MIRLVGVSIRYPKALHPENFSEDEVRKSAADHWVNERLEALPGVKER